ncbi:hypothetical protein [Candidatus Deferrimicrobium sp.]|uniref:hypothetical protein n=1 Tax=Candidatus Deferrimicrobium sp. TaxID=3060586 RepID=UPI002ED123B3
MTGKSALYALAVAVLMGTMAVAALAGMDYYGSDYNGPADSSVSSQPEQGIDHQEAGEIREPMETGAVPGPALQDPSFIPSVPTCCSEGSDPTFWPGGP